MLAQVNNPEISILVMNITRIGSERFATNKLHEIVDNTLNSIDNESPDHGNDVFSTVECEITMGKMSNCTTLPIPAQTPVSKPLILG